jgi:hypothetical protein
VRSPPNNEITLERLERALAIVSFMILRDGPIYTRVMTRLEAEITALRAKDDVMSRARRNLEALQAAARIGSDDVKAIA